MSSPASIIPAALMAVARAADLRKCLFPKTSVLAAVLGVRADTIAGHLNAMEAAGAIVTINLGGNRRAVRVVDIRHENA